MTRNNVNNRAPNGRRNIFMQQPQYPNIYEPQQVQMMMRPPPMFTGQGGWGSFDFFSQPNNPMMSGNGFINYQMNPPLYHYNQTYVNNQYDS